jgi:multidrug efflux pump subunit AcrA (membrane-fusion protein)
MTETKTKRRGWVKNAVIIFLVVLLILTFFSNTILNRSLPEVAYQYPSSGSITAQLRGTGTVSSNETYEVTINEVRKVKAVAIKVGDEVTAGQNIILLDETESDELTQARKDLDDLELAYQKKLLELSYGDDSAESVQLQILQAALNSAINDQSRAGSKESSISSAEARVATAKAKLESAETKLGANTSKEKKALDAAQTANDNAVAAQTQAKTNLEYYTGVNGGEDYSDVMKNYETAAAEYIELQSKAQELNSELLDLKRAQTSLDQYEQNVEDAQAEVEEIQATQSQVAGDLATLTSAAAGADTGDVTISNTVYITDKNDKKIYLAGCSESELRSYLRTWTQWLVEEGNNPTDTDVQSSETLPSDGTKTTSYVTETKYDQIANDITTLESLIAKYDNVATVSGYVTDKRGRSVDLSRYDKSGLESMVTEWTSWQDSLKSDLTTAQQKLKDAQKALSTLEASTGTTASSAAADIKAKENEIAQNTKDQAAKQKEMDSYAATVSDTKFTEAYNALLEANELVNTTTKALYDAQTAYNAVYSEKELEELQEALTKAQDNLSDVESEYAGVPDLDDARQNVLSAQKAIEDYYDTLDEAELNDALADLDLQAQKAEVEAAQAKVDELEANVSQQVITAEYGGVITEMNVGAGSMTVAGEPMCVIERTDNGYSMSFSVTSEQAAKVKVGDQAQLVNQYGTDITAVLSNITTDKDNPGTNKLLVFSLSGSDVVAGQELTVSIGERSASYDLIVPNSAIRTDSSGKFVLAITVKSSPLGNRFIAKRVDVEVLASDDNNSAIRGDLSSGDTIITTSSTPIESGQQVRLAE